MGDATAVRCAAWPSPWRWTEIVPRDHMGTWGGHGFLALMDGDKDFT